METMRKFTFNTKVEKTAFLIINPKRKNKEEKLNNQLKQGEIQRTSEYRYLGEWYTEKGNHKQRMD